MNVFNLDNNELLAVLEKKKSVKYNKGTYACVTYLIRADTNIRDEIKAIVRGLGDKYTPQNKVQRRNAKKLIEFLKTEKSHSFPTGLLILIDSGSIEAFEPPYSLDISISPDFDYKFNIDPVLEHLRKWRETERKEESQLFRSEFNNDLKEAEDGKKDLIPGLMEVQEMLEQSAYKLSRIYITTAFKRKKGANDLLKKVQMVSVEVIELTGKGKVIKTLKDYGEIAAFTYYKEEQYSDIKEEDPLMINNPRLPFEYNDKSIIDGFEIVEPVDNFIKTEMKIRGSSNIYYLVARRADGKSQAAHYIIRHYIKGLKEYGCLPVFCKILITLDKNNNIIDFWKYLRLGFQNTYPSIKEDDELYSYLKENKERHNILQGISAELDEHQKKKGWSDEKTVREIVKNLTERKIFKKIILFMDELDKPNFKPVIYNFFNYHQNLFSDLFKYNCNFFICATPDWFDHITKEGNLNFYMGTTLQIPELIRPDQCRSLIYRRYAANNLALPIKIPDEGYRLIMEASKGIRRTILDKWLKLVVYCKLNKKNYLSMEEIESILNVIPPNIKTEISTAIRSSNALLETFIKIHETGDSFLDAIEFVYNYGDKYPLNKIENPEKQIEIKRHIMAHGFDLQEFSDSWEWMRRSEVVDKSGRINKRLTIFMKEFLEKLNSGVKSQEYSIPCTPKNLLETVNNLNDNWSVRPIMVRTEPEIPHVKEPEKKEEKVEKADKKSKKEKKKEPEEKEDAKEEEKTEKSLSDWEKYLLDRLNRILGKDLLPDEVFKKIEGTARSEIHARLESIFKELHLGNLTFTKTGLMKLFSPLESGEDRLIKDFLEPPSYVKGNPSIYYGIVASFLKLIPRLEMRFQFSIEDVLSDWISKSGGIEQFNSIRNIFKDNGTFVTLIELMKSGGRRRTSYLTMDEIEEERISSKNLTQLISERLLFEGTIYVCDACGAEIVVPGENVEFRPVLHTNCRGQGRIGILVRGKERFNVRYMDPNAETLLFLLRFIFGTRVQDQMKEVYLQPSFRAGYDNVDAILVTKKDLIIGIKVVTSGTEVTNINKKIPKIFSDFWFIPTKHLTGRATKSALVPITKNMNKWLKGRLLNLSSPDVKAIRKFHDEL